MSFSLKTQRSSIYGNFTFTDPLEQVTFAHLKILVHDNNITEFFDNRVDANNESLCLPMLPIAEWFVWNWWSLFYEPLKGNLDKEAERSLEDREWIRRHCLRCADSSLFLPVLNFYSVDNDKVTLVWTADDPKGKTNNGYFLNSGSATFPIEDVMKELSGFIRKVVLEWCEGMKNQRLIDLRLNWASILIADEEAQEYCRAAGFLGLNPYSENDQPKIESFLERTNHENQRE